MAITYPLVLPASPGFKHFTMRKQNIVGMVPSEFTGEQQVQLWQGEWWEADCSLPPMVRATAETWAAFLVSLRGKSGTFLLGDPAGKTPRGSALGNPAVDGGSQTGTQLSTLGWDASQLGVLKRGDYLQIAKNYLTDPRAFDNAAWTKNQCSVTATNIVAPNGAAEAERVTPDVGATDAYVRQVSSSMGVKFNRKFSFGVWLKAASGTPSVNIYIKRDSGAAVQAVSTANLTTSWQFFSATGTTENFGIGTLDVYVGSATTWVEAEGAIDMWGAALWSSEQDARLHKLLGSGGANTEKTDLDSDANGKGVADIYPRLRESPPDFSRIIVSNAGGLFRLAENATEWDLDELKNFGVGFKALEAF